MPKNPKVQNTSVTAQFGSNDPHAGLTVEGDRVAAIEPLIDLAVVLPQWDGLLHPRFVTRDEMKKLFPEFKP